MNVVKFSQLMSESWSLKKPEFTIEVLKKNRLYEIRISWIGAPEQA